MRPTVLTSEAKDALKKTVRSLRQSLLDELADALKGEYRLDAGIDQAKLPEARRCRRERLEIWLDEQVRAAGPSKKKRDAAELRQRCLASVVQEAAHTLLNRLVLLRILEHHGAVSPAVVTGGDKSDGYANEFIHYAGPLGSDDSRGYRVLLETVFAELALDLPGLYGPVGLTSLVPIPAATLRDVITALNDPALDSAWGDDTTLGWVYQYWNDPEREALDAKIAGGGKIEPHEIASKTQMFTERYMVEWLLQNSLGLTWLSICKKNGWTLDAERVLPALEARRAEWRAKREAGEVALEALMPIEPGLEDAWKYYVPQPIPEDAVASAPSSIRELRLLDPACGSGHFLVIAFDLLARLYEEEARHRGETWSKEQIAESIVENNLHGIDIDPRAIQIAAAALAVKARLYAPAARLTHMNLVAPVLRLGHLPKDDPALAELETELETEVGLPKSLITELMQALAGVDHLGSLLRVDDAIEAALRSAGERYEANKGWQGHLFNGFSNEQLALSLPQAKQTVLGKLEQFLARHSGSEDLGIRLAGEQLASGVRFVRIAREGTYDIVVGNPPYQGISKTTNFDYVVKNYPRGKADLYAAFLERGLELVREGGISALLTMRGWMFLGQFAALRKHVLANFDLRSIGDFDRGAFDEVPNEVLAVSAPVVRRAGDVAVVSVALQPTPFDDTSYDRQRTNRKRAAVLAQVGRYEFDPKGFAVIEGEPIVYWWTREFLEHYAGFPKLKETSPGRFGLTTGDNDRFVRFWHETAGITPPSWNTSISVFRELAWVPFVLGGKGRAWIEPYRDVCRWCGNGLEVKEKCVLQYGTVSKQIRNEDVYFKPGVAFAMIGANFSGRLHRYPSVIGNMGSSVYPPTHGLPDSVCLFNSRLAKYVLASLNPGVHFEVGDVNRLPTFPAPDAAQIVGIVTHAFATHESHREPSVEFKHPGQSSWRYAQTWAQLAVDRPKGGPLPPYEPEYDPPAPEAHVSFAVGAALGRFGASGEGILERAPDDALPAGILFVGPNDELLDSLSHPGAQRIQAAWSEHAPAILAGKKRMSHRDWLRKEFFAYQKALYENRPIYFPLSSEKKSFVAWVSIHRWADNTLQTVLADHLHPCLRKLDGEISDLNAARASSDKKAASGAEKRYAVVKKLRDELFDFIEAVSQCAERGAPPTDPKCPPRKADAPFRMDLDDGVMINSAALWPLLAPQWNDPKKWWKHLCLAEGKKDYDWSHLARRYFPLRVEEKCKTDPSLAVAHGCFWKYHPAKAYAWELRLQDEIREGFTIDEADSDDHRARFLADHAAEARDIEAAEHKRRERKRSKTNEEDPDLVAR